MADLALRLGVVAGVAIAGGGAGWAWRRLAPRPHPPIDLSGIEMGPGLVVFTDAKCATCHSALAAARRTGAPLREITYDLEPGRLEGAGVAAVPLTVVVGPGWTVVAQFPGVPSDRQLRRALVRAGRS